MAQFTITASNITTNSATIELTSEIAHTAASSVDVTVVSSNGVEAYAGTTTIPVGSIGDVISVPVTGLRSNMEYTVTAKTGTTYTDTGTFTTTDDPTARTATQSQWEDLADKVEAASVAQSTLYDALGSNTDGAMTQNATTNMIYSGTNSTPVEGNGNIRIGFKNQNIPTGSATTYVAIGHYLGYKSHANQNGMVTIGYNTGFGQNTVSIGIGANASSSKSVAIGANAGSTGAATLALGPDTKSSGGYSVAVGNSCQATGSYSVVVGGAPTTAGAPQASASGSVAIGAGANATSAGEFNIGSNNSTTFGYNNSNYRLLTGLYDGQGLHDAATVAQGNTLATSAPTTSTEGVLGQLYTDTTNMHTYQCTAIDTTDPSNPVYTWVQRW